FKKEKKLSKVLENEVWEHAMTAKELQQSEEKFRSLVEDSPLAISLIGKNGEYKYVNPRFIQIFGYNLADLPNGQEWFKKAFPQEDKKHEAILLWKNDLKLILSGKTMSRIFTITCKDNSLRQIKFQPVIIENQDCLVNYEDITEQINLEAQLRQAQKMEALGTLTGGIAHDFNNILSIIIGYSEMVIMKKEDLRLAQKGIREIKKASLRARDIVQHLLTFIRKTEQELKIINIIPVLKETTKMLRASISANIDFKLSIPEELPFIKGDSTQIHQVLLNLASNASHAMAENGGTLAIGLEHVVLEKGPKGFASELFPGDFIRLTVTDTGRGILQKDLERIFDPYFTTKDVNKGSGLGLSVVLGIVKSYKGGIHIGSVINQGTEVDILLPTSSGTPESEEDQPDHVLPVGNERILFVDDEQMIVDLACQLLLSLGYSVTGITHPRVALDLFKDNPNRFDIVITDMGM
ncbi:MAG: PAS domain S-box protein, partial [Desulfobacteraceae bacterium]|nr:PAS domain S-box protein [Desulfobacteraceae bacterium]